MSAKQRLSQDLSQWAGGDRARETVRQLIVTIADAGIRLARRIAADDFTGTPPQLAAEEIYETALRNMPVSFLAIEDRPELLEFDPDANFGVALDPLDGSSNVGSNQSIGSIFSILETRADELTEVDLGARQRAAGFLLFGPQTLLVLSVGEGTMVYLLDPHKGEFRRSGDELRIPQEVREFALNTSNYRFWDSRMRHFVDDCIAGEEGAFGVDFNMRWNAALVAETYRVLVRGGIFLYPADTRPGYQNGRLSLLHEALPIAMLVEQAGGAASDGHQRILEMKLPSLHARVPLVFGSGDRVHEVTTYLSGEALDSGHFPLFVNRSLLRA